MKMKNNLPPSRQGKKQIIAYVSPEIADQVRAKADKEGKTNTEVVAEAMNAVFESHGRSAVFPLGHNRIVRRHKGISKVRTTANAPRCRAGTRPVGAWFDAHLVKMASELAAEQKTSKQDMLLQGLRQLFSDVSDAVVQ